jgi:hypothetical protein
MRHDRLSLILVFWFLPAGYAGAQTLPWPTDPPRAGGAAPLPGAATAMGAPQAMAPAPMAPMAPMEPPPGASPFGAPQGQMPPCVAEFLKLREDVQKKGLAAKAAGQRKVSREDMCKYITTYAAAETKWVKYAEGGVTSCGIPREIVQQLKTVHGHTEETREKICAPAVAAAPSLSDALGTTRLPTPETTHTGSGTLDTLMGNAIQR